MKIVRYEDVSPQPVTQEGADQVNIRWLIAKEDGAPHFAMRLFEIKPGGHTPIHRHSNEHEVFFLEGEAAVVRDGKEVPVSPGTAVYVPPDEEHGFINRGKGVVRMLCMVPI
ncbi:MAG TPA: cupin domain-containing protein [bacterium]